MSDIRAVYFPVNGAPRAPNFPATDQNPEAVRYVVGLYVVDAIGGAPTQAELDTFLGIDAASEAERARQEAIDEAIRQDAVIQQIKAMSPAEYDTWWAANVTNAAQTIAVLKRVVRILCRKVL